MPRKTRFKSVKLSLADILGADYVTALVSAGAKLTCRPTRQLRRLATQKVDLFPAGFQKGLAALLAKVGSTIVPPSKRSPAGASTAAFNSATRTAAAPLTGWGYYRVGEDGRLYFLSKSEHYHASVGHAFPGYRLLEHARRLGIPNATHNNTRGRITRILEEELVRTANGLRRGDRAGLRRLLRSRRRGVLNRVLNLATGSLAAEAGLKLLLGRFHTAQDNSPQPRYSGRVPVIVVIGDEAGGLAANYHGTTLIAQTLRGMWPALRDALDSQGLLKVVAVRPNSIEELEAAFRRYDRGRHKIAGVICELVLMNYGALRLTGRFVRRLAALCRRHDAPLMLDEIQSCGWSPQLYMFREYGVRPEMVAVGKGLPGGEYAASRIIFNAALDCLPQFGALVTNGQEELASLAYLITLRWAEANSTVTGAVGEEYHRRVQALARRYRRHVDKVGGRRHMASIYFHNMDKAQAFVRHLVNRGLDISVQAYKADCPPVALTKLPLIAGYEAVDMVVSRMADALRQL